MYVANLDLLLSFRRSKERVLVDPALVYSRGVVDYVIGDIIVELKTSESVLATHVYQAMMYAAASAQDGLYDTAHSHIVIDYPMPALHYARYGAVVKLPPISMDISALYPGMYMWPVSRLVHNEKWTEKVFDNREVSSLCTDLEGHLITKGIKVEAAPMHPGASSALGTFVDVFMKVILTRNLLRSFAEISHSLGRASQQLRSAK